MSNSQLRRPGRLLLQLQDVSISSEQSLTTSLMRSLQDNVRECPEGLEESLTATSHVRVASNVSSVQSEWLTLHSVSADFHMGKTYAFLTEGVSPVLRVMARFVEPQSGRIRWKRRPFRRERLEPIAYIPRNVTFSSSLTVNDELLNVLAASGQNIDSELFDDLIRIFRLASVVDVPVQYLDALVRYQFLMARSLLMGARLLLLDEPTLGMSSMFADELLELLAEVAKAGFVVVIQTRSPEVAARCDEVFLLMSGQLRGVFLRPDVDVVRLEYAGAMRSLGSDSELVRSAGDTSFFQGTGRGGRMAEDGDIRRLAPEQCEVVYEDGDDDEEVAPRWVPTRHSDRVVLTPIPDAVFFPGEDDSPRSEGNPEIVGDDFSFAGIVASDVPEGVGSGREVADDDEVETSLTSGVPVLGIASEVDDREGGESSLGGVAIGRRVGSYEIEEVVVDLPLTWDDLLPVDVPTEEEVGPRDIPEGVASSALLGPVRQEESRHVVQGADAFSLDLEDGVEESVLSRQVVSSSPLKKRSLTTSSAVEKRAVSAPKADASEEFDSSLPEIPVAPRIALDPDSVEVIALAKDILKDLPGSVVPEADSR